MLDILIKIFANAKAEGIYAKPKQRKQITRIIQYIHKYLRCFFFPFFLNKENIKLNSYSNKKGSLCSGLLIKQKKTLCDECHALQ